jgi:hypothetical protein
MRELAAENEDMAALDSDGILFALVTLLCTLLGALLRSSSSKEDNVPVVERPSMLYGSLFIQM